MCIFEDFKGSGKMELGIEFQSLEIMGRNVLKNEVIRHFSNLAPKGCWESANHVLACEGNYSFYLIGTDAIK